MYNRYIPQPDGSFHRRQIPDTPPLKQSPPPPEKNTCPPEKPESKSKPKLPPQPVQNQHRSCSNCRRKSHQTSQPQSTGISTFLKQLLPRDFDTGDLMVILLLLLMSSDAEEDQNSALLTLALYLFL